MKKNVLFTVLIMFSIGAMGCDALQNENKSEQTRGIGPGSSPDSPTSPEAPPSTPPGATLPGTDEGGEYEGMQQ